VKGVSPVVPVVEASFNLSMACWNKTKVHVAGVPLSSVNTRL